MRSARDILYALFFIFIHYFELSSSGRLSRGASSMCQTYGQAYCLALAVLQVLLLALVTVTGIQNSFVSVMLAISIGNDV